MNISFTIPFKRKNKMAEVDLDFAAKLKKYGAVDFDACYNCGTCTAVCSLTEEHANFPRMFIRYGVLGLKDEVLHSKELWLCYACGDCTETCPRQANPGDYMAALRRYAIAEYEPTGLTKLIFTSNPFSVAFTLLLAVLLGFFLLTLVPEQEVPRWLFRYMPFEVIHDMGLVAFALLGLSLVLGALNMLVRLSWKAVRNSSGEKQEKSNKGSFMGAVGYVVGELAVMKRYRDCDSEENSFWYRKPWLVRPWFVHWSVMWGFIGLLLATTLNFIFKDPATLVWWPTRILGTASGLLMMYGATLALTYRIRKVTRAYTGTRLADWLFLSFLWLAGLTGFWLEIAVFLDADILLNHLVFILHTVISMELVILFAFSKFAHAIYRPIALFMHHYYKAA